MNLAQIINALPLQVYIRRGELVIHFSSPTDLVSRLAETSATGPNAAFAAGHRELGRRDEA
jgi:hypothetical protein